MKKDYEIGSTFQRGGTKFTVVEDPELKGCIDCDMFRGICSTVHCEVSKRADGKDVVFKLKV